MALVAFGPINFVAIKIFGGLLLIVSIIEFGIGGTAFASLQRIYYGAWWSAVPTFFAGLCGLLSSDYRVLTFGCCLGICGILTVVGGIYDGFAATDFYTINACGSVKDGMYYGSELESKAVSRCFHKSFDDEDYAAPTNDCTCVSGAHCLSFNLNHLDNCGDILNSYPNNLRISAVICFLLTALSLTFSILICLSMTCCGSRSIVVPVDDVQMTAETGTELSLLPQAKAQISEPMSRRLMQYVADPPTVRATALDDY